MDRWSPWTRRPWYLRLRVVLPDEQIQRQVEKAERFWKVPIFIICRDRLVYLQRGELGENWECVPIDR